MTKEVKKTAAAQIEARRRVLDHKRAMLLDLDPEEALDRILQDPEALPLAHSFPPEDFYLLFPRS